MKVDQVPSSTPLGIFFEHDKGINEGEIKNKPEQVFVPLLTSDWHCSMIKVDWSNEHRPCWFLNTPVYFLACLSFTGFGHKRVNIGQ